MSDIEQTPAIERRVSAVFLTFLKLGLTSFGGPMAHIGYFHRELVERQRWVSEAQFGQLLAICQFLPGPASSQLGFALGLTRAGWAGAIAAFLAFTLPSALLLLGFASILPLLTSSVAAAAIHGLKLVAFAVVADALLGMFSKLCPDALRRVIATVAACIVLLAASPWMQLVTVCLGAVAGWLFCRESVVPGDTQLVIRYGHRTGLLLLGGYMLVFILPVLFHGQLGLAAVAGAFYQVGALVFGGGHVVLPLVEDVVVATGWISQQDFLVGYGAAQAIPGPMFAFSAYLGALIPTGYPAWVGAATALLFIFLPGFLLLGAALPLWQSVSGYRSAGNVIAGVNAAVVGLLAAALYNPVVTTAITAWPDLLLGLVAFGLLRIWHLSVMWVLLWCLATSVVMSVVLGMMTVAF